MADTTLAGAPARVSKPPSGPGAVPSAKSGPRPLDPSRLYDIDGYTWARQQAAALRRRDIDAIDWENVSEELEGLARTDARRWMKFCARTLEHLLKIEH